MNRLFGDVNEDKRRLELYANRLIKKAKKLDGHDCHLSPESGCEDESHQEK